jgi:NAD(P)-dependent dehydrogenase (short-subunit alcohol dehydrogenase family)
MKNRNMIVLIEGGSTELTCAAATMLLDRGTTVALFDPEQPERSASVTAALTSRATASEILDLTPLVPNPRDDQWALAILTRLQGAVDALANLSVPTAGVTADALHNYTK